MGRITDGVISPVRQEVKLTPHHAGDINEINGVIELSSWQSPFPKDLYGHHQLVLELWVADPQGKYELASSDWMWIYVTPGCVDSKDEPGIDYLRLKSINLKNYEMKVDSAGTKVLANQTITVKWELESAGLPSTAYGFPGSLSYGQVVVVLPTWPFAKVTSLVGSHTFDLSGLAIPAPTGIPDSNLSVIFDAYCGSGCQNQHWSAFVRLTRASSAQPPPSPPPQPVPDIVSVYADYEPTIVHEDEPVTVRFYAQNQGTAATGPFTVRIEMDDGTESQEMSVPDLSPGASWVVGWNIPGLKGSAGTVGPPYHYFYCYWDRYGLVNESRKDNNLGYLEIILY